MNDKRFTLEDVLSWQPCWIRDGREDELRTIASDYPDGITALEMLDLPIKYSEKLWLVFREPIFDRRTLRLLACWFAERALLSERSAGREPDPRSWAAVEVARRYAGGRATEQELQAALEAARAARAEEEAARATRAAWAAEEATWAAVAAVAAVEAAGAAARAAWATRAAWAAVEATGAAMKAAGATRAEAEAAERQAQIDRIRGVLTGVTHA